MTLQETAQILGGIRVIVYVGIQIRNNARALTSWPAIPETSAPKNVTPPCRKR